MDKANTQNMNAGTAGIPDTSTEKQSVTTDQIKTAIEDRAGGAEALDAAAASAMRGEQSADPVQQQLSQITARLARLEGLAERPTPVLSAPARNMVSDIVDGAVAAAVAAYGDRVAALEQTIARHVVSVPFFHAALTSLNDHFGGKLSFLLPPAPAAGDPATKA